MANHPTRTELVPRTWRALTALLFAGVVVGLIAGCEDNPSDNGHDGRYPPPDSGNTAVVYLSHRLLEPGRDAQTAALVEVLSQGNRTVDASVSLAGQGLPYDSRELAFADIITPPLIPGASYQVRVRSATWGEDTTYVYLPGDFDLSGSPVDTTWEPGMAYTFSWEQSSRADRYIVRINLQGAADALVQDTVAADDLSYTWTIGENARGEVVRIRVTAERGVRDIPVWQGSAQSWHDFGLQIQP